MAKHRVLLHSMTMGDCEDPYLYAADPIMQWQETEKGRWCMDHVTEQAEFHVIPDPYSLGFRIDLTGWLEEADITYFKLRWQ